MAIAADQFKNVRISFWNHIKTEIFDTAGYAVRWDGIEFDPDAVTIWVEPFILAGNALPRRASQRNEEWLFQINCFTKVGPGQEYPSKIWDVVGTVRAAFDHVNIDIADWDADGDPTIAYLVCHETSVQPVNTEDPTLMQVAVTFRATVNE